MVQGKINPTIRLLDQNNAGTILPINDETQCFLRDKHPDAIKKIETMLLQDRARKVNPIIYEQITGDFIRGCAMKTKGASGRSGLDANFWRRIVGSSLFGTVSDDLCHSIASMTRQLCAERIPDPESISSLMSCRLIPLDKSPGVRPICIGEVLRRIIEKAVMIVVKSDIIKATAYMISSVPEAGCEVAVHAVSDLYELEDTRCFIQVVDASNVFNSINRQVLLHNVEIIFPGIENYIINCYTLPARTAGTGTAGTAQGDQVAMGMYATGLMPMLNRCSEVWWDKLLNIGKYVGYHVNESKSLKVNSLNTVCISKFFLVLS